jgi:hypothetical protein
MSAVNARLPVRGKWRDSRMDRASFLFALVSSQNRLSSRVDPLSPAPRVGQEGRRLPNAAPFPFPTRLSRWQRE